MVLDHGRNPTSFQARCRWCRWRSGWGACFGEASAEHDRHLVAVHGARPRRGGRRLALVAVVLVLGVLAGLLLQAPRWLAAPPPPTPSEVAEVWAVTCSPASAAVGGGERR